MSTGKPNASAHSSPVKEIAPQIYQIQMPLSDGLFSLEHVNLYLIKGNRECLLIDTGWNAPEVLKSLETRLFELGLRLTDISKIVITHAHPDHYGLTGTLKKLSPGTRLIMHHIEAGAVESRYVRAAESQARSVALLEVYGVPTEELTVNGASLAHPVDLVAPAYADELLFGGETVSTGNYDLEVIWTPGHSPGAICLYEPRNEILFSGDHILPGITPNVSYNTISGDNPLGDYLYALGKFDHIPIKMVHPGHEQSFSDIKGRISSIIEHHRQRENEIYQALGHGENNAYQIAAQVRWNSPGGWKQFHPLHKWMAAGEVIAHLEHMRWNGRIRRNIREGRVYYRPVL